MREFVYLDEVSVYSLLASRLGAVASEFTEAESSSLTAELRGTVSANAGVLKSTTGSKLETKADASSQVVRKSIIQSSFKELYEIEKDRMILRPRTIDGYGADDDESGGSGAASRKTQPAAVAGGVPASGLKRGLLVEIEVELGADDVFQVLSTLELALDMSDSSSGSDGASRTSGLTDAVVARQTLRRLLAGLIPLNGRALDYRVAVVEGKEYVVPRDHDNPERSASKTDMELRISAVAEEVLFWRDVRRILFAGARFRMLCRVGRDGLHRTTNSLKQLDVMRAVAPSVADDLAAALQSAMEVMKNTGGVSDPPSDFRAQLAVYGRALANRIERPFPEGSYGEWVADCEIGVEDPPRDRQTELLRDATEALSRILEVEIDADIALAVRGQILEVKGPEPVSRPVDSTGAQGGPSGVRFLDVEVVAIYW